MATKKTSKPQKKFIMVLAGDSPNDYAIHCTGEKDFVKQIDESGDALDISDKEVYDVYIFSGQVTVKPASVSVEDNDGLLQEDSW